MGNCVGIGWEVDCTKVICVGRVLLVNVALIPRCLGLSLVLVVGAVVGTRVVSIGSATMAASISAARTPVVGELVLDIVTCAGLDTRSAVYGIFPAAGIGARLPPLRVRATPFGSISRVVGWRAVYCVVTVHLKLVAAVVVRSVGIHVPTVSSVVSHGIAIGVVVTLS